MTERAELISTAQRTDSVLPGASFLDFVGPGAAFWLPLIHFSGAAAGGALRPPDFFGAPALSPLPARSGTRIRIPADVSLFFVRGNFLGLSST